MAGRDLTTAEGPERLLRRGQEGGVEEGGESWRRRR